MRVLSSALVLVVAAITAVGVRADDGAASIAAGGLVIMKREPRIVMAKEVLSISARRVVVDYDFRNDSDEDITTEVAFPIPAYQLDTDRGLAPRWQGFDDFKLWVADKPVRFSIDTRAFVGNRDVTELLRKFTVDIGSFGHYKYDPPSDDTNSQFSDWTRLTPAQRTEMIRSKLIADDASLEPQWRVEKKYHWTQTFPAHVVVHIRHQYTPVLGNSNTVLSSYLETGKPESEDDELPTVCPSTELRHAMSSDSKQHGHNIGIFYVDFILTTANTWQRPIEDFTLLVERPPRNRDPNHPATDVNFVSFCWNGPVQKLDANHFVAHATNFIPAKELRIGFLQGYLMAEAALPARR